MGSQSGKPWRDNSFRLPTYHIITSLTVYTLAGTLKTSINLYDPTKGYETLLGSFNMQFESVAAMFKPVLWRSMRVQTLPSAV